MPGQPPPAPRKEPFFSLIASFFVTGLGTILNGEVRRGFTFMACFYLSPVVALIISILLAFVAGSGVSLFVLLLLALVVSAVTWLWALIDAYKGAEAHNARHGLH